MADKSWDEKMRDFDAGKPICEVHQDPNPNMRFSLFGDECDDLEQQSSPSPKKAKKEGSVLCNALPARKARADRTITSVGKAWTTRESLDLMKRYVDDPEQTQTHNVIARKHSKAWWNDESARSHDATRQEFAKQIGKGKRRDDYDAICAAAARLEQKKREEHGGGDMESEEGEKEE